MTTRQQAVALDDKDPLASFRARFLLPDDVIYLDGNSLGPLTKAAKERLQRVIGEEWGQGLIQSWNAAGWHVMPQTLGAKIAKLIGAKSDEVVCADGTSVNLFKLLSAALQLRPGRRVIVSDDGNFPTDLYVAQGLTKMLGGDHEFRLVGADDIPAALDQTVAVLMMTEVDYRSGRLHDMVDLTKKAHAAGALVLWDLCHSAGALPVDLNGAGADLAVGCGYKYLNGGPGAPSFLFVAERHQNHIHPAIAGWHGHAEPFAFEPGYRPADGIDRMLCSTIPVLSIAAFDAAIDVMLEADIGQIRDKSIRLFDLFVNLVETRCAEHGFQLASPRAAAERGSQVSFAHADGYAIMQALIERGVIGDFRAPNLLRFGFAPLYLRYQDIWDAVDALNDIMATETWRQEKYAVRKAVT